jgi:hypothetical protein
VNISCDRGICIAAPLITTSHDQVHPTSAIWTPESWAKRLARAGKIENKHEAVMAPKFRDKSGPPVLCTDFYRKLQRR